MEREIVKIDEKLCDGCGQCVPECHEGALQIIDGKARLISDLMCDGLGACIGHCPQGAISIEKREAQPYDEIEVIGEMVKKGENTVIAHLSHLKEHGETGFLKQGVNYLLQNAENIDFDVKGVIGRVHNYGHSGGCPGSAERTMVRDSNHNNLHSEIDSELTHWPVQMHLINPVAQHFRGSDMVLAADCVAFSMGNFHQKYLRGKTLAIACPKLDTSMDIYFEKIIRLIDEAGINTLAVMMMEVPCCSGLLSIVKQAVDKAYKKVPIKKIIVGIKGEVLQEEWI